MTIVFCPRQAGDRSDKLAEAEIHFAEGPLAGMRLVGFAVWESAGKRTVSMPGRQHGYGPNRRTFSLFRSITSTPEPQNRVRDMILEAYRAYEKDGSVRFVQPVCATK